MKTALSLVTLMLLSSVLPGCLETVSDVIEDDESTHPYAAPKEAMGMWWPTIDGYIEIPTISPFTEWYDSDMKDIKFTDEVKAEHPATLRYKSVEEGMALAVEIDGVEETPQKITVTLPDRTLITEVTAESDNLLPQFEIDCTMTLAFDCSADESKKIIDKDHLMSVELLDFLSNNEIASVHNLDDDNLVMEASAKQLFDDTTEVSYTITIEFEESIWVYTTIVDFNWVLPFLFPRSDISVTGIEVTQAVQTADMQMRLVEGKTSLARVYVDSGDLETANVEVTLNFCIVIFCFDEMTKTHVAVQNPDRTDFTHSANFVLPDHWVTFDGIDDPIPIGLVAKITPIYPTGAIDYVDPDTSNNHEVGVFWFNHTRDFTVWAVPIGQNTDADAAQEFLPAATINNLMQATEALLPVSSLNQVNFPTASAPLCNPGNGLTADACNQFIQTWLVTTLLQNCGLSVSVTMVLTNTGDSCLGVPWPDQIHGMTPVTGTAGFNDAGGISTPMWSSNGATYMIPSLISNSGTCGPTQPTGTPSWTCVAHEMTHNLGPYCMDNNGDTGAAAAATSSSSDDDCLDLVDEAWGAHLGTGWTTSAGTVIGSGADPCGAGGWDQVWNAQYGVYNIKDVGWNPLVANPDTNSQALIPSGYPDYMSYCPASLATNPGAGNYIVPYTSTNSAANGGGTVVQWTSTIRWEEMYDKFLNWDDGDSPDAPYNGRQTQNYSMRVISGIVPLDGTTASLDHSWASPGQTSPQYPNYGYNLTRAQYTVVTRDGQGQEIDKIRFDPIFVDANGNDIDHYFTYALIESNANIHSIELLHNGTIIDSLSSSNSPVIRMLPLGTTEYTRENPANLSWTQASPTSNRQTLYQLEYSWRTGVWLPIGGMTNSTSTTLDFGTLPATMQGEDSKFRVRATNGFDTYYSESTSFRLPNQAPVLTLETSGALGLQSRWSEIGGTNTPITITQGDSFSIKPEITDADWTALNEDGSSAVLKRDGEIVWADGRDNNWNAPNRVVSWPAWNRPLAAAGSGNYCGDGYHGAVGVVGGTMCSFNFPNADLLPGEMKPGAYEFEMTYEDEAGSSVTKTVSFSIIVPNFLVGPNSNAKTEDVLDEYRSNLQSSLIANHGRDSLQLDDDLSRDELQYYVELERAARGDDNALSDADIIALQEFYGISDTRAAELEVMICVPPDCDLLAGDSD